ncbi:Homogentisate 1,2-dioxygenase [Rhypophila decipiens]
MELDPYKYQCGFGNHHATEAIPGALPRHGTNLPQKCPYGLYAEHLNGTSFISPRDTVTNVWMYRERPAAAHRAVSPVKEAYQIQASFLPINPDVSFTPLAHAWGPLTTEPSTDAAADLSLDTQVKNTTFVQGLHTIGGHGDATLREGLAVHQYAFNADMCQQAFANHDGEFLLVPQKGTLDIKTEMGMLCVRPGMIAVLPAGIRFSIALVRSSHKHASQPEEELEEARGYVLEIFGSHYTLPELGVLGANGLAHLRDFEYPVAAFDFVSSSQPSSAPWKIILKLAGRLNSYSQPYSPFNVVAWHGRYAPYRYNLSHFAHLTANSDQLDPTAYTVLTAPSKYSGVSLVDFCIFGEKWAVVKDSWRIAYYHRTMATEVLGVIKGMYLGSVRPFEEGGLRFEQAYMPHGETYEAWKRDREDPHKPKMVGKDSLGFMFHISSHFALTKWAMEDHPDIRLEQPGLWDTMRSNLMDHIDEINANLKKAGMPILDASAMQVVPSADMKHPKRSNLPTPPPTPF